MTSSLLTLLDSCVDAITLGTMLGRDAESVRLLREACQILGIPLGAEPGPVSLQYTYVYPVWQFYRTLGGLRTIPGVVETWETLRLYNIPAVAAAHFFTSPNEWLRRGANDPTRPIDILRKRAMQGTEGDIRDVIAAARAFERSLQILSQKA